MKTITVTTFNDIGRLLLPWPTSDRPDPPTVRELAEDPDHPALHVRHRDHGGWTHAQRIATCVSRPEVDLIAPAHRRGTALELEDCCHRICALYQVRPDSWSLVICCAG